MEDHDEQDFDNDITEYNNFDMVITCVMMIVIL